MTFQLIQDKEWPEMSYLNAIIYSDINKTEVGVRIKVQSSTFL